MFQSGMVKDMISIASRSHVFFVFKKSTRTVHSLVRWVKIVYPSSCFHIVILKGRFTMIYGIAHFIRNPEYFYAIFSRNERFFIESNATDKVQ